MGLNRGHWAKQKRGEPWGHDRGVTCGRKEEGVVKKTQERETGRSFRERAQ